MIFEHIMYLLTCFDRQTNIQTDQPTQRPIEPQAVAKDVIPRLHLPSMILEANASALNPAKTTLQKESSVTGIV